MARVKVVPWVWRNGRVHLEVMVGTWALEGGTLISHVLVDGTSRTTALCGERYDGRGPSGTGLNGAEHVDCAECTTLLAACTFTCEVGVAQGSTNTEEV